MTLNIPIKEWEEHKKSYEGKPLGETLESYFREKRRKDLMFEGFYNEVMSSKAILRYEIKKREEELLNREEK